MTEADKADTGAVPKETEVTVGGEEEVAGHQDTYVHVQGNYLTGPRHVVDQNDQLHPTCSGHKPQQ